MTRAVPGIETVVGREFVYLEIRAGEQFPGLLSQVLESCPDVPSPSNGGAIEEKARIVLKDSTSLLALSYKGDLEGWRKKLDSFCRLNDRRSGVIRNESLLLSDGTEIPLNSCRIILEA